MEEIKNEALLSEEKQNGEENNEIEELFENEEEYEKSKTSPNKI